MKEYEVVYLIGSVYGSFRLSAFNYHQAEWEAHRLVSLIHHATFVGMQEKMPLTLRAYDVAFLPDYKIGSRGKLLEVSLFEAYKQAQAIATKRNMIVKSVNLNRDEEEREALKKAKVEPVISRRCKYRVEFINSSGYADSKEYWCLNAEAAIHLIISIPAYNPWTGKDERIYLDAITAVVEVRRVEIP